MDEKRTTQDQRPESQEPIARTDVTRPPQILEDRAHGLTEADYQRYVAFNQRFDNQQ